MASSGEWSRPRLVGRENEGAVLESLVSAVRAGRSQVLTLRGEAGVGKTSLLEFLAATASGCQIARATGVEAERELAFAGLHQLCAPMLGNLYRVTEPQRDALSTAFGLSAGLPPDRFLVGLAVLSLFAEVAEESPLVCLIDDAQWLDRVSAQTLAFVARRLLAERVALVLAVREPSDHEFSGLPDLLVSGLDDADAGALLDSVIASPVDESVRDRIVAESRGNPLALIEFPRSMTAVELAGGFGVADPRPLAGLIEQGYLRRLQSLPEDTRRLVVVAAAEPLGDPVLLWQAAERLGIGAGAALPAADAGLLEIGTRVRFSHPLVRSAAYRAAPVAERLGAHAALAEATDPERDPDRRAWHRAHSVISADEDIASALERSADRARARGGIAASAAFLERATGLTPDPARRATRALAAAHAMQLTGAHASATQLLSSVRSGIADELQLAHAELLRAQIAFTSSRGSDAPPLLLKAAKQLEPLEVSVARETYLDAMCAAIFAGRLALGAGLREVAAAARDATRPAGPADFVDLMLDGLSLLVTDGYAAGTPDLRRALRMIVEDEDAARGDRIRWLWVANNTAMNLWDDDAWDVLSQRQVDLTRQSGALAVLPIALNQRLGLHFLTGELGTAESLGEEAMAISRAVGTPILDYGAVGLAALRGKERVANRLIDECVQAVVPRGEGIGLSTCLWARAVLANALGQYPEALVAAQDAAADPDELTPTKNWALLELVEAGVRTGQPGVANGALAQLERTTWASGTHWAAGVEARARALVTEGPAADTFYREAIERLEQTRIRVELDRTRLLYGEWLRRDGRRSAAREQLRLAHDSFERCGYEAFAERARRELLATGETVRKRSVDTRNDLTPQEAQIAGLAADANTNQEIAALLFLSPRTVEWHLRKIYTKLGISSRRELRRALHS